MRTLSRFSRFRQSVKEAVESPAWGAEILGALGLIHYGRLLGSPVKAGNFSALVSQLLPHPIWDDAALWIGLVWLLTGLAALFLRVRWHRLRQGLAVSVGVLWAILIYSCWKGDSPFVLWEIFVLWGFAPFIAFLLIHLQHQADEEEEDDEGVC